MPLCHGDADGFTVLDTVPPTDLVAHMEGGGLHDIGHVWARVNALSNSLFLLAHPPSWPQDRHLSCFSGPGAGGPSQHHHTRPPDPGTWVGGPTPVPSKPLSGWRWSSARENALTEWLRNCECPRDTWRILFGLRCICSLQIRKECLCQQQ